MADRLRRRRAIALGVSVVVPLALVIGLGHRGQHAVRNLLVPGSGLYDHDHLVLGLALTLAFVAATVAWVRAGVDWAPVAVLVVAVVVSAVLADDRPSAGPVRAAHEFPLVVLVVGALGWLRTGVARLMPAGTHARRARLEQLSPVDRAHAVAVAGLAGDRAGAAALATPDVARRSARIGWWARGRRGGDPFRIDHAGVRAARTLVGLTAPAEDAALVADGGGALDGVPASEPGWCRLLDGTVAALAQREAGDPDVGVRWSQALHQRYALRRGHRPAAVWTPLGLPIGRATAGEHATATALARAAGWCGDDDWAALRRRALAAAARGARRPDEQRLVAAGRVWLTQVDDPVAASVLARPSLTADPLAVALDRLAERLRVGPDLLRRPELVGV